MSFINQLLENFKEEKFIHFLETVFGVLDLADMQSLSKYKRGISVYCVQLICLVNMPGLVL